MLHDHEFSHQERPCYATYRHENTLQFRAPLIVELRKLISVSQIIMQDHFEKIAMDRALEVGGKKTFELLDESIKRFTESLQYTETGGKEIRSEIAGYRKGLLELFRTQLFCDAEHELKPAKLAAARHEESQGSKSTKPVADLREAQLGFEKEITAAIEQLADSYTTSDEATAAILAAARTFVEKVTPVSGS